MPLALHLAQNVDAIVVAQCARHLVVVHRQMVLLDAPQLRQAGGVDDLEDARVAALPRNEVGVALLAIVQQLLQEVPQQATVCGERERETRIRMGLVRVNKKKRKYFRIVFQCRE